MIISSILSYLFIMVVLYLCASASSRKYVISMRRGVVSPPHFLTPEVLLLLFFTFMFAIGYNVGVDYLNYLDAYESGISLNMGKCFYIQAKSH